MNVPTVAFGILAPISLLSQLLLIYGYSRIKKMRRYPEIMVLWQCISQSAMDLHWMTGLVRLHEYLPSLGCQLLGAFFVYFYFINWDYILFLSIEILIKVKHPFNCNQKNRAAIYHLSSHLSSLAIFILLSSVTNNDGNSIMGTCFVQQKSIYDLVIFIPIIIHYPICIYACCNTVWISRSMKHANYAKHHIYVVVVFSLSWVTASLAHGLSYQGFDLRYLTLINYVNHM